MRMTRRGGFTLVEMLISLVLLAVVMGTLTRIMLNTQRGYIRQRDVVSAEEALRAAEVTLVSILRSAGANPTKITGAYAPTLDPDPLGNGAFDNLRVVSDFNPADGDTNDLLEDVTVWVESDTLFVQWQAGTTATAAAAPIRSVEFEYYGDDDTPLTAAEIADARRVKLVITAPRHGRTTKLTEREQWVYLRNR